MLNLLQQFLKSQRRQLYATSKSARMFTRSLRRVYRFTHHLYKVYKYMLVNHIHVFCLLFHNLQQLFESLEKLF